VEIKLFKKWKKQRHTKCNKYLSSK
jgi:hypothetical protein